MSMTSYVRHIVSGSSPQFASIIDVYPGSAIRISDCTADNHVPVRNPKHRCSYCCGETYDDARGHCGACGAPRGEERHWPGHDYGERAWDDSFLTMQWNPGVSSYTNWANMTCDEINKMARGVA